jgi:acetyl-CoA synthetase/medium-chain acyl-CoA synthetase
VPRPPLKSLAEYQRAREGFRLDCPEHFNFGHDVIDRWAEVQPDARALWWVGEAGEERTLTFSDVAARSNQVANAMAGLGLERGDQVMLNLPSIVPWWESMVGLTKADMIEIPTTTQLTEKDIAYRVEVAEIDAVITDTEGAEKIDRLGGSLPGLRVRVLAGGGSRPGWVSYEEVVSHASPDFEPLGTRSDGQALIYFASGTTGPPKMVLHTHASFGVGQRLTADFWLALERGDVHWNMSDTGWAKTAYCGYFGPWISGATVFLLHRPGKFDPADVLETLAAYPIDSICAPPTIYRMLVQQDLADFRPKALRECQAAGEPLNPAVLRAWREETGLTIREGYGQTETVFLCGNIPDLPVKPGSMGLPPPGIDLAVIDAEGKRLPPGEPGEIGVRVQPDRPLGLFEEYWHNKEATAKCYREGWYLTGDCARTDEEGYFWFEARSDDVITSSAYRIGPFEVENALMEHPAVAEVAVVGKPDPERTEIVKAFVVLANNFTASDDLTLELQEHTKKATAPYKYPREIEFMDELPKTVSGKIRRVELRERA